MPVFNPNLTKDFEALVKRVGESLTGDGPKGSQIDADQAKELLALAGQVSKAQFTDAVSRFPGLEAALSVYDTGEVPDDARQTLHRLHGPAASKIAPEDRDRFFDEYVAYYPEQFEYANATTNPGGSGTVLHPNYTNAFAAAFNRNFPPPPIGQSENYYAAFANAANRGDPVPAPGNSPEFYDFYNNRTIHHSQGKDGPYPASVRGDWPARNQQILAREPVFFNELPQDATNLGVLVAFTQTALQELQDPQGGVYYEAGIDGQAGDKTDAAMRKFTEDALAAGIKPGQLPGFFAYAAAHASEGNVEQLASAYLQTLGSGPPLGASRTVIPPG